MRLLKITLAIYVIILALLAIILIWIEDDINCSVTTCKTIETLFIVCSLALTREVARIKEK